MRSATLLREAWSSAWAARVPTFLILLATAAMTFATAATAGRSAALAEQLDTRIQDAGARVIAVTDLGNEGFLDPAAVETITALSSVDSIAAVTHASTVTNAVLGWGGPTVNAWGIVGADPSTAVELRSGRWPGPGEALVSTTAAATLRMSAPSGALVTREQQAYAVVGSFAASGPLEWLNQGVVYTPSGQAVAEEARVVVSDLRFLGPTERTLRQLLAPTDPANLRLTAARDLAEVSQGLGGDVRVAGYETTLIVLLVGALFVGAVTLADVLIRRRDLGRRRALGITRFDLMALITLRTLISTVLGAALGVMVVHAFSAISDAPASLPHTMASAVLVITSAILAALPAGLLASRRDPVSVLRTA